GVRRTRRLNLVVVLQVESTLEGMLAEDLADIVLIAPDRVEILVVARRSVVPCKAHRRGARLQSSELKLRQKVVIAVRGRGSCGRAAGNRKQHRNARNQGAILAFPAIRRVVGPRVPTLADGEFVDQRGRELIGPGAGVA